MKYLFYKLYRGALFIREGGDPELRAYFVFSLLEELNLYNIYLIIVAITNSRSAPSISDGAIAILTLFVFLTNYLLFLYKDKYLKIAERYKHESKTHRLIGIYLTFFYVFISVSVMFYVKTSL